MGVLKLSPAEVDETYAKYSNNGPIFEKCIPAHWGDFNSDNVELRAEVAAMIQSVEIAGDQYRIISLGAAPGEWPLKAEQAYKMLNPEGNFRSFSLEGDLDHFDMMKQFLLDNGASIDNHEVFYKVIAHKDGFAYFPIINPVVDWGAGSAAVADTVEELDDNMTITDVAKSHRIGANDGKPLEYRTVEAMSLDTLLAHTGIVDFLHCDIQGAERDVIPAQMEIINKNVKICCVGTHGKAIDALLSKTFEDHGWTVECHYPCVSTGEGENESLSADGVYVWSNPRLF